MTKQELPLVTGDKWRSPMNDDSDLQAAAQALLTVENRWKQPTLGFQRTRQYLSRCSAAIKTNGRLREHQQQPLALISPGSDAGRFMLRPFAESSDVVEATGVQLKQYLDRSDSHFVDLGLKVVELDEQGNEHDYLALVYDTSSTSLSSSEMSVVFPVEVNDTFEAEHRLLVAADVVEVQESHFESAEQEQRDMERDAAAKRRAERWRRQGLNW